VEEVSVPIRDGEKRAVNRVLRGVLYASVVCAIGLVTMLVLASSNTATFDRHYTWVLWATIGLTVVLLLLVLELVRRLVRRYRAGVFGTRLTVRLAIALILMTLIPASFIYLISVQVLGRSIESWFDVPVERALDSGLNLGRVALDAQVTDLAVRARRVETELVDTPVSQWPQTLNRLREQLSLDDVIVTTLSGRVLVASGAQSASLAPDIPPPNSLRQLRTTRQYSAIEGGDGADKSLRVRVLRLMSNGKGSVVRGKDLADVDTPTNFGVMSQAPNFDDARAVQLIQLVPTALAENAEAVQRGQRDYQELSLARKGLKRIYRITLTLTLLLTLFSAIAGAFLLAGWLTGPLTSLAAGTRAVAAGDFRPMKNYTGRDELGTLTDSFNDMTRQLDDARAQVSAQSDALMEVNLKLESVMSSINVGVALFDRDFNLLLANQRAQDILGEPLFALLGKAPEDIRWLSQFAPLMREKFTQLEASGQAEAGLMWEQQVEVTQPVKKDSAPSDKSAAEKRQQSWQLRGTRLADLASAAQGGYLVVMDEITAMLSAQRAVAWSEVAKRLAHEIKNPLTPIQLAAERMEAKLSDKLPAAEAEFVRRSTQTIVNQVAALKQMVDEFREYARLPTARILPVDLGAVVLDILSLYPDGMNGVTVSHSFDSAVPAVMGDQGQLRQIVHNLIKNAAEALEDLPQAQIEVSLEAIRTRNTDAAAVPNDRRQANVTGVRLIVRDNGPGFASQIQQRAFEPYVTTKAKGTGLGLAIVKKIVDDHGALIELSENLSIASNSSTKAANSGTTDRPGAQIAILFTRLLDKRGVGSHNDASIPA
jgi:nitrogen fixation/metabolism regulation signal transduction histidine kinase